MHHFKKINKNNGTKYHNTLSLLLLLPLPSCNNLLIKILDFGVGVPYTFARTDEKRAEIIVENLGHVNFIRFHGTRLSPPDSEAVPSIFPKIKTHVFRIRKRTCQSPHLRGQSVPLIKL